MRDDNQIELHIRPAAEADLHSLLAWRNDPRTIAASRDQRVVTPEDHSRWFAASLASPDRRIYIAEIDGQAVGTVRVDRRDDGWELSWTVAPDARGRSVGKRMVSLIAETLTGPVYAEVRPENAASAVVAMHAGLREREDRGGILRFWRRVLVEHGRGGDDQTR